MKEWEMFGGKYRWSSDLAFWILVLSFHSISVTVKMNLKKKEREREKEKQKKSDGKIKSKINSLFCNIEIGRAVQH